MMYESFLDYDYLIKNMACLRTELNQKENLISIKIAILAGSTVGTLKDFLEIHLLYHGIKAVIWEGTYNRIFEEACYANKELEEFSPDYIYIHMTNKNILKSNKGETSSCKLLEEQKARLQMVWESLMQKYKCIIIQNNLEYPEHRICGNTARIHSEGVIAYIDQINGFIHDHVKKNNKIFLNDINYLSAKIGLDNWFDDRLWFMYKYPVSMKALPHISFSISNIIKSSMGRNKKIVVCDLDNTLWGGVIGEVGSDRIEIGANTPKGEMYKELQQYLKRLTKLGISLSICSKNEMENGLLGFTNTESVLEPGDFIDIKINWQEKYKNIKDTLNQINLLPGAAVFIDDNPVECDSVKTFLPEISVLHGKSPLYFMNKIDQSGYFEVTYESEEDSKRQQYYYENELRANAIEMCDNYEDYLESLEMKSIVISVNSQNIERAVQLLNKTNQFNFAGKKYSITEIEEMAGNNDFMTMTATLEDKFGSNGLVSVLIGRMEKEILHIEQWVMSCRVFQRGLEYAVLDQLVEKCRRKNIKYIFGYYMPTAKNQVIAGYYGKAGFQEIVTESDMQTWRLDLGEKIQYIHHIKCENKGEKI